MTLLLNQLIAAIRRENTWEADNRFVSQLQQEPKPHTKGRRR